MSTFLVKILMILALEKLLLDLSTYTSEVLLEKLGYNFKELGKLSSEILQINRILLNLVIHISQLSRNQSYVLPIGSVSLHFIG